MTEIRLLTVAEVASKLKITYVVALVNIIKSYRKEASEGAICASFGTQFGKSFEIELYAYLLFEFQVSL